MDVRGKWIVGLVFTTKNTKITKGRSLGNFVPFVRFVVSTRLLTTKITKDTKMEFDELSNRVLGCALTVHRELGPGLLESTYEQCLAYELGQAGIAFKLQHPLPVHYRGVLECGYRIDLLVEERLILELKSVEALLNIHFAQVLTYMKLSGIKTGLLINFNVPQLKSGIKRFVL
jgi:GxxExxY protein